MKGCLVCGEAYDNEEYHICNECMLHVDICQDKGIMDTIKRALNKRVDTIIELRRLRRERKAMNALYRD